MKASEVLAGALEFWGQGGEQWVQRELKVNSATCLVGGISKAAFGYPRYWESVRDSLDSDQMNTHDDNVLAYRQAMKHVWDELDARDVSLQIREDAESTSTAMHEYALVHYNDDKRRCYGDVKSVVCGAVKRALAAEDPEDGHVA